MFSPNVNVFSWTNNSVLGLTKLMFAYAENYEYQEQLLHMPTSSCDGMCQLNPNPYCENCKMPSASDGISMIHCKAVSTICRYIGTRLGHGLTPANLHWCDYLDGVIDNVRTSWKVGLAVEGYQNLSEHTLLLEHQRISLTAIENWMQSRQYLGGDIPIYADFIFYKLIENHQLVFPEILDNLPHIRKQIYNFKRLPGVCNYISSKIYSDSINLERMTPVVLVGVYGRRYSNVFYPIIYG